MVKRSRRDDLHNTKTQMKLFNAITFASSVLIGGVFMVNTPAVHAASCDRLADLAEQSTAQFQRAYARGDFDQQSKYYVRAQSYVKQAQRQGCF